MAYQHGDKMGSLWYSTGRGESPTYNWPAPVMGETKHWHPDSHAATTEPSQHTAATTEPSPCATAPSEVEQPTEGLSEPDPRRTLVQAPTEAELVDLVLRLGRASDPDPFASGSLWRLIAAPHQAAQRLVGELRVLSPDRIDDDARHVFWCVRALAVIAGRDFSFNTTTPLTASQCRLYRTCYGRIPFFIEPTVGGTITVAPADVQKKVIAAWQLWILDHRDILVPHWCTDPLDWCY
jgi:hypothetical protein